MQLLIAIIIIIIVVVVMGAISSIGPVIVVDWFIRGHIGCHLADQT